MNGAFGIQQSWISMTIVLLLLLLLYIGYKYFASASIETITVKPCIGCVDRNVREEYGDKKDAAKLIDKIDSRVKKLMEHFKSKYGDNSPSFNPDNNGVIDVIKRSEIYSAMVGESGLIQRNQTSNAGVALMAIKNTEQMEALQERINQLVDNYDSNNIFEINPDNKDGSTSFTENKKKLVLCLREKTPEAKLHDINTMMFVVLHEVAHMMNSGWGHQNDFWDMFRFVLENADECGIYKPVDYRIHPVKYCGMDLTTNPMFTGNEVSGVGSANVNTMLTVIRWTGSNHIPSSSHKINIIDGSVKIGGADDDLDLFGESTPSDRSMEPMPIPVVEPESPVLKSESVAPTKSTPTTKQPTHMEAKKTGATMDLYSDATLYELKLAIQSVTNIPFACQHIEIDGEVKDYKLTGYVEVACEFDQSGLTGSTPDSVKQNSTHIVDKYPVDEKIRRISDQLRVTCFDLVYLVRDVCSLKTTKITVHDLRDFISPTNDIEFIYYSFCIKYFPAVPLDAFRKLVSGEQPGEEFPMLFGSLSNRLKNGDRFSIGHTMREREKVITGNAVSKTAYGIGIPLESLISKGAKNITCKTNIVSIRLDADRRDKRVDVIKLFQLLKEDEEMPVLRLVTDTYSIGVTDMANLREIVYTKLDRGSQLAREFKVNKYRHARALAGINSPISALWMLLKSGNIYVLTETGRQFYEIDSSSGLSLKQSYSMAETEVSKLCDRFDSFGRQVYLVANAVDRPSPLNMRFYNIGVTITFHTSLTPKQYADVISRLSDCRAIGLLREGDGFAGNLAVLLGHRMPDMLAFDQNNQYEIFAAYEASNKFFSQLGIDIAIDRKGDSVRIVMQTKKAEEFEELYRLIVSVVAEAIEHVIGKSHSSNSGTITNSNTSKNLVSNLREKDPNLYNLSKYGSKLIYSRLCQKAKQPVAYFENELPQALKSKAVKYWNFTTETPMYYICGNSKYPNLSFIVNKHQEGYCLPCCKKTKLDADKGSSERKRYLYNSCINNRCYSPIDTTFSRYITKYGKEINVGRLSSLPDILEKYVVYNIPKTAPTVSKKIYTVEELRSMSGHVDKTEGGDSVNSEDLIEGGVDSNNLLSMNEVHDDQWLSKFLKSKIGVSQIEDADTESRKVKGGGADLNESDVGESGVDESGVDNTHTTDITFVDGRIYLDVNGNVLAGKHILDKRLKSGVAPTDKVLTWIVTVEETDNKNKTEGYYLYAVSHHDLSGMYCLADSMQMPFSKMVLDVSEKITDDIFRHCFGGTLVRFYENYRELQRDLKLLALKPDESYMLEFSMWFELFVDLIRMLYDIHVIIISDAIRADDNNTANSADGTQATAMELGINPDSLQNGKNFILLFKRYVDAATAFSNVSRYYCIYGIVPKFYFKHKQIKKRLFANDDGLVKLLLQILRGKTKDLQLEKNSVTMAKISDSLKSFGLLKADKINIDSESANWKYLGIEEIHASSSGELAGIKFRGGHFVAIAHPATGINDSGVYDPKPPKQFKWKYCYIARMGIKGEYNFISYVLYTNTKIKTNNTSDDENETNPTDASETNVLSGMNSVDSRQLTDLREIQLTYDPVVICQQIYNSLNSSDSRIQRVQFVDEYKNAKCSAELYANVFGVVLTELDKHRNQSKRKQIIDAYRTNKIDEIEMHENDKSAIKNMVAKKVSQSDFVKLLDMRYFIFDINHSESAISKAYDKVIKVGIQKGGPQSTTFVPRSLYNDYKDILIADFANPVKKTILDLGYWNLTAGEKNVVNVVNSDVYIDVDR